MSEFNSQFVADEQPQAADPSLMLRMQDARFNDDGSTTKGFAIGAGVAVGGLLLTYGLMRGGILPSIDGTVHATSEPSKITQYISLNEGCVSDFDTNSGAEAEAKLRVHTGKVGHFFHVGDFDVAGASIKSGVKGVVRTEVCQSSIEVPATYLPADHSLNVTIPNGNVYFKASMPPETRVTSEDAGAIVAVGKAFGDLQSIITNAGIPTEIDTSHSLLASLAEMRADQTVVESCAPKVESLYQADLKRYNLNDFLDKAKVFHAPIDPNKITVTFSGDKPNYTSEYADALDQLIGTDIHTIKGKTDKCEVAPTVANQIQQASGAVE